MTGLGIKPSWDIFCKIVDNFGDIGICWRLAKQLQTEYGLQVTLWIDDFSVARKIITTLDTEKNWCLIDSICIAKWDEYADFNIAAEVVIEAFACTLPLTYLNAMQQKKSKWVNLEYLSAELWVASFHGKPSPQNNGLIRYFFFPGFTETTGGLIRESNLLEFQKNANANKNLKISLFCYPHAPIFDLLTGLSTSKITIDCYVPASSILPKIANFFGRDSINIGETLHNKSLNLHILPFLNQVDYDQLLYDSDLNFVRGEDSLVRAIWAGNPFIWQPYLQENNTHITKLHAFLSEFYADSDEKQLVYETHDYWSSANLPLSSILAYLNALPNIKNDTLQRTCLLSKQTDLATKLVDFCNKI